MFAMIRYVFIDCEMGGRELNFSLLTAAFVVLDQQFNHIGTLSLKIKPDDGVYVVSGQGMGVNKIDLASHDKIALPYKVAKTSLYDFLKRMTDDMKVRLTPVGHGIKGDIDHILANLISRGSWEQFCTYHYIDTSVVLQFLRACGKMPFDVEGSVGELAKFFGVGVSDDLLHNAVVDAELTANVYKKMVELGKS